MKFRLIFFLFFLYSCTPNLTTYNQKKIYAATGFAYIFNDYDFNNKVIKGRLNNDILQISHQNLRTGTLVKIINPKNKKSLVLKNIKRVKYPEFYKILITQPVAIELGLSQELPIVEILEIKKNKSFIAKKAKIYNEERKISSKAPVASVEISNISKDKTKTLKKNKDQIFLDIGTFYSSDTAVFLKKRIIKKVPDLDNGKLKIKKVNDKETQLISGPYTSVNLLKNDYIKLKNFGFEELDIFINE